MTHTERRAWAELVISGLIFFWFQQRMLDGWQVVDQAPLEIFGVMIGVVVASIVGYAVAASILAGMIKDKTVEDERDVAIEGKAMRNELIAISVFLNIVAFHVILREAYAASPLHRWGQIDLGHAPSLVFALFSILWIGEWVRLVSVLIYSRDA